MGKKKSVEARAAKFIERVVQKLSGFRSADIVSHLEQAVATLPPGDLQSALASDLTRFASRLQERLGEPNPVPSKNQGTGLDALLRAARGSVSTDEAFTKAVDAAISAAEKCGSENVKELPGSIRRLLTSRVRAPVGLWWAYSAVELLNSPEYEGKGGGEQRCMHVVSTSREVMDRVRSLTLGRCDPVTSVAALAPVVALLFQAGCLLKSASDRNSKAWRKAVKSLMEACTEMLSFTALENGRTGLETSEAKDDQLGYRGLVLAGKGVTRVAGVEVTGRKGVSKLFPLWLEGMVEAGDMQTCACAVAGEALLLKLAVRVLEERSRRKGGSTFESPDFCDELRFLAVHGGSDLLLDLLVVSKQLSVEPLLDAEEEVFLRGILYDVIAMDSSWPHEKYPVFMKKLTLARRAIKYYRSYGSRTKALKLSSRVSLWDIPSGFTGWLQSLKVKNKPSEQILQDSRALLGWLTDTADDGDIASILCRCTKTKVKRKKLSNQKPVPQVEEVDDTFIVDTKGEPSVLEALDKAFVDACETMRQNQLENEKRAVSSNESDDDADGNMELDSTGARIEEEEGASTEVRSLDLSEGDTNATKSLVEDEEDGSAAKGVQSAASVAADKLQDDSAFKGVTNEARNSDLAGDDNAMNEDGAEEDDNEPKIMHSAATQSNSANELRDAVQAVLDEAGINAAVLPSATAEVDPSRTSEKPGEVMETAINDAKTLDEEPENTTERESQAEVTLADKQLSDEAKVTTNDILFPKDMEMDEQPSTPALERKAETKEATKEDTIEEVVLTQKKTGRKRSKDVQTPKRSFLDAPVEVMQTPSSIRYTRSGRKYGDAEAVAMSSRKKQRATKEDAAAAAAAGAIL